MLLLRLTPLPSLLLRRPDVIVNTCCPGMVHTDLVRSVKERSVIIRAIVPIYMGLVAQSPEVGSRTYLASGLTAESEHV
jgi:NAD(P)-dependent dehydrogenase (short-subunit alcohol dehydrogenase family)